MSRALKDYGSGTCKIPGCAKPRLQRKRLCAMHYSRKRRNGSPHLRSTKPKLTDQPCTVEGCGRKVAGRGLCATHWQQWKRRGDPLAPDRRPPRWTEEEEAILFKASDGLQSVHEWIPDALRELPGRSSFSIRSRAYKLRQRLGIEGHHAPPVEYQTGGCRG